MTNEQKYKTYEERANVFDKFCKSRDCRRCTIKGGSIIKCILIWLTLEAEKEKPEPCPFCNNEYVKVEKGAAGMPEVVCSCGYRSLVKDSESEVIAAHNRVCRAVKAAKEGDEK